MDKLFPPRSATTRHRSSSDFKSNTFEKTFRERQIRRISQEKNSHLLLDTSYVHKPESHLPSNDKAEISLQLTILKKNFDRQCSEWLKRDTFLSSLKSEMEKITEIEKEQISHKQSQLSQIKNIKEKIVQAIQQQELEEDNREIFFHILDRMRTTIVHLKSKTGGYKESLHKRSFSLLTEKEIFNKTKESRVRTAIAYSRLKNVIDDQKKEEIREVEEVEKNVERRKVATAQRTERRKKQAEIIERAMIESQSSKLEDLRERYFLNKLWYSLSTLRFEREQLKSKKFEDAYFKIKLATGINDVPLFVEKCLTREKNYRDMLHSVKQKEKELNEFKEKIDFMQNEVERFNSGTSVTVDQKKKNDIHRMHKEIRELMLKKITIVQTFDKIKKWVQRIKQKLQINNNDLLFSTQLSETKKNMLLEFYDIKATVLGLLKGMNKAKLLESYQNKGNLQQIIKEIPDNLKMPKRYLSMVEKTELLGLETEMAPDEVTVKKIKKN